MKTYIETACFHNSSGTTLIHSSNKNAEWITGLTDVRECFGQLFTKESGDSILLLKPVKATTSPASASVCVEQPCKVTVAPEQEC